MPASMPSLLRIVGFLVAALLVLIAIRRLQGRGSGSRVPAVALLFVGLGLATVSIAPDFVRPIQNILGLEGEPLGRLVTLLVITVAIAYAGLFYALARPIGRTRRSAASCGRCRPRRWRAPAPAARW